MSWSNSNIAANAISINSVDNTSEILSASIEKNAPNMTFKAAPSAESESIGLGVFTSMRVLTTPSSNTANSYFFDQTCVSDPLSAPVLFPKDFRPISSIRTVGVPRVVIDNPAGSGTQNQLHMYTSSGPGMFPEPPRFPSSHPSVFPNTYLSRPPNFNSSSGTDFDTSRDDTDQFMSQAIHGSFFHRENLLKLRQDRLRNRALIRKNLAKSLESFEEKQRNLQNADGPITEEDRFLIKERENINIFSREDKDTRELLSGQSEEASSGRGSLKNVLSEDVRSRGWNLAQSKLEESYPQASKDITDPRTLEILRKASSGKHEPTGGLIPQAHASSASSTSPPHGSSSNNIPQSSYSSQKYQGGERERVRGRDNINMSAGLEEFQARPSFASVDWSEFDESSAQYSSQAWDLPILEDYNSTLSSYSRRMDSMISQFRPSASQLELQTASFQYGTISKLLSAPSVIEDGDKATPFNPLNAISEPELSSYGALCLASTRGISLVSLRNYLSGVLLAYEVASKRSQTEVPVLGSIDSQQSYQNDRITSLQATIQAFQKPFYAALLCAVQLSVPQLATEMDSTLSQNLSDSIRKVEDFEIFHDIFRQCFSRSVLRVVDNTVILVLPSRASPSTSMALSGSDKSRLKKKKKANKIEDQLMHHLLQKKAGEGGAASGPQIQAVTPSIQYLQCHLSDFSIKEVSSFTKPNENLAMDNLLNCLGEDQPAPSPTASHGFDGLDRGFYSDLSSHMLDELVSGKGKGKSSGLSTSEPFVNDLAFQFRQHAGNTASGHQENKTLQNLMLPRNLIEDLVSEHLLQQTVHLETNPELETSCVVSTALPERFQHHLARDAYSRAVLSRYSSSSGTDNNPDKSTKIITDCDLKQDPDADLLALSSFAVFSPHGVGNRSLSMSIVSMPTSCIGNSQSDASQSNKSQAKPVASLICRGPALGTTIKQIELLSRGQLGLEGSTRANQGGCFSLATATLHSQDKTTRSERHLSPSVLISTQDQSFAPLLAARASRQVGIYLADLSTVGISSSKVVRYSDAVQIPSTTLKGQLSLAAHVHTPVATLHIEPHPFYPEELALLLTDGRILVWDIEHAMEMSSPSARSQFKGTGSLAASDDTFADDVQNASLYANQHGYQFYHRNGTQSKFSTSSSLKKNWRDSMFLDEWWVGDADRRQLIHNAMGVPSTHFDADSDAFMSDKMMSYEEEMALYTQRNSHHGSHDPRVPARHKSALGPNQIQDPSPSQSQQTLEELREDRENSFEDGFLRPPQDDENENGAENSDPSEESDNDEQELDKEAREQKRLRKKYLSKYRGQSLFQGHSGNTTSMDQFWPKRGSNLSTDAFRQVLRGQVGRLTNNKKPRSEKEKQSSLSTAIFDETDPRRASASSQARRSGNTGLHPMGHGFSYARKLQGRQRPPFPTWGTLVYSNHPRMLMAATPHAIFSIDLRSSQSIAQTSSSREADFGFGYSNVNASSSQWNSSYRIPLMLEARDERIFALTHHSSVLRQGEPDKQLVEGSSHLYTLSTAVSVLLMDERRPENPILRWDIPGLPVPRHQLRGYARQVPNNDGVVVPELRHLKFVSTSSSAPLVAAARPVLIEATAGAGKSTSPATTSTLKPQSYIVLERELRNEISHRDSIMTSSNDTDSFWSSHGTLRPANVTSRNFILGASLRDDKAFLFEYGYVSVSTVAEQHSDEGTSSRRFQSNPSFNASIVAFGAPMPLMDFPSPSGYNYSLDNRSKSKAPGSKSTAKKFTKSPAKPAKKKKSADWDGLKSATTSPAMTDVGDVSASVVVLPTTKLKALEEDHRGKSAVFPRELPRIPTASKTFRAAASFALSWSQAQNLVRRTPRVLFTNKEWLAWAELYQVPTYYRASLFKDWIFAVSKKKQVLSSNPYKYFDTQFPKTKLKPFDDVRFAGLIESHQTGTDELASPSVLSQPQLFTGLTLQSLLPRLASFDPLLFNPVADVLHIAQLKVFGSGSLMVQPLSCSPLLNSITAPLPKDTIDVVSTTLQAMENDLVTARRELCYQLLFPKKILQVWLKSDDTSVEEIKSILRDHLQGVFCIQPVDTGDSVDHDVSVAYGQPLSEVIETLRSQHTPSLDSDRDDDNGSGNENSKTDSAIIAFQKKLSFIDIRNLLYSLFPSYEYSNKLHRSSVPMVTSAILPLIRDKKMELLEEASTSDGVSQSLITHEEPGTDQEMTVISTVTRAATMETLYSQVANEHVQSQLAAQKVQTVSVDETGAGGGEIGSHSMDDGVDHLSDLHSQSEFLNDLSSDQETPFDVVEEADQEDEEQKIPSAEVESLVFLDMTSSMERITDTSTRIHRKILASSAPEVLDEISRTTGNMLTKTELLDKVFPQGPFSRFPVLPGSPAYLWPLIPDSLLDTSGPANSNIKQNPAVEDVVMILNENEPVLKEFLAFPRTIHELCAFIILLKPAFFDLVNPSTFGRVDSAYNGLGPRTLEVLASASSTDPSVVAGLVCEDPQDSNRYDANSHPRALCDLVSSNSSAILKAFHYFDCPASLILLALRRFIPCDEEVLVSLLDGFTPFARFKAEKSFGRPWFPLYSHYASLPGLSNLSTKGRRSAASVNSDPLLDFLGGDIPSACLCPSSLPTSDAQKIIYPGDWVSSQDLDLKEYLALRRHEVRLSPDGLLLWKQMRHHLFSPQFCGLETCRVFHGCLLYSRIPQERVPGPVHPYLGREYVNQAIRDANILTPVVSTTTTKSRNTQPHSHAGFDTTIFMTQMDELYTQNSQIGQNNTTMALQNDQQDDEEDDLDFLRDILGRDEDSSKNPVSFGEDAQDSFANVSYVDSASSHHTQSLDGTLNGSLSTGVGTGDHLEGSRELANRRSKDGKTKGIEYNLEEVCPSLQAGDELIHGLWQLALEDEWMTLVEDEPDWIASYHPQSNQ